MIAFRRPSHFSLLIALAAMIPGAAMAGGHRARIQKDVLDALGSSGRAPVIVLLSDPLALTAPDSTRATSVDALQRMVMAAVPTLDVTHVYELLPALGGEIDVAALRSLAEHPAVDAIELAREEISMIAEHVEVVRGAEVHTGYGFTGEGVTVAVLDTGIDTNHPDLADDLVAQRCFSQGGGCGENNASQGPDAEDENGHGTSVSSIITSGGEVAAKGVAPDAGIAAIRVFNDRGSADTRDIAAGLDWALRNRRTYNIKVVNMSLGSTTVYPGNCDSEDEARSRAVNLLVAQNITVFAASGNDGANTGMSAPGCLFSVVSVGATYDDAFARAPASGEFGPRCFDENTTANMVACFSNVSRTLDIVAPGVWTTASTIGGGTSTSAGTSNASPLAAGVAALLYELKPNIRPREVERILKDTGDEAVHPVTGLKFSRVNALAAFESLVPVTNTPAATATASTTPTPGGSATSSPTPTGEVTGDATSPVPSETPDETATAAVTNPVESDVIYLPVAWTRKAR